MALRKKSIDEWALDYYLLQSYAMLIFRMFYRKVCVVNRQNLPVNQPVILAPNHQNALMDAMVLVCRSGYQVVFLARADIFKGKFLIRFLTFINIMPIFRIRDGYENVKKNDMVFEKTLRVLRNKHNPLGMFPEGNHGDRRRLRQLVKGIFRIAFMAQEDFGSNPGVKIVPIGIDYSHYQHFRSTVLVNIGKPIEVSEFYPVFKENPVQGINQLKERYAAEQSKLMIDIQTEEFYDLYMFLRNVYNDNMRRKLGITGDSLPEKFAADKVMIDLLNLELEANPGSLDRLNTLTMEYQAGLKSLGLRDWVLKKEKYPVLHLLMASMVKVILFPVFAFGFVNNYPLYWFAESRIKGIKDPQFRSSFKFVIGMLGLPAWYIALIVILIFIPIFGWIKLLYILSLPVTGLFSFEYYIRVKKLLSKIRYSVGMAKGNMKFRNLKNIRENILHIMNDLVMKQTANHENTR
jgi:1-acyl-sn-glycerol-3-phosphate acyltransferase